MKNPPLKKLRILKNILKNTNADKIIFGFIVFIFISAFIVLMSEPSITKYGDALWYCYMIISTVGFGDVIATTFITKICSVLITVYSLFVIAIATGVVASFYTEYNQARWKESVPIFLDKLERLPELSKEELEELAQKVKNMR